MHVRTHAFSATTLQDACGGAEKCLEILKPTPFAMGQTHIYDCRNPATGRTMPIGAVALLERHQNWRFYSLKLFRALDLDLAPEGTGPDVQVEACEAFEAMAVVQRTARMAAHSPLTENAARAIEAAMIRVEGSFARIRAAMDQQLGQAVAA